MISDKGAFINNKLIQFDGNVFSTQQVIANVNYIAKFSERIYLISPISYKISRYTQTFEREANKYQKTKIKTRRY